VNIFNPCIPSFANFGFLCLVTETSTKPGQKVNLVTDFKIITLKQVNISRKKKFVNVVFWFHCFFVVFTVVYFL
jgi:hypothetical protein